MASFHPWLPGVHRAANIQKHAAVYEIENAACDPDGLIEEAMSSVRDWRDALLVDLGCGTGFHLPRFAATARHVFGIEPHDPSRLAAMRRCVDAGLENVSVLTGSAEHIPLRDQAVDVVHARFAYFFAPECGPGVVESMRVLRPGGALFVVENDRRNGTFASWLARSEYAPPHSADVMDVFWREQGFAATPVASRWEFRSRDDLEAVLRIEFPPKLVPELLAETEGTVVDYHFIVYSRRA
jgi:ubiquinone/menaquinone biosynthesis C-methylase UbiE